MPKDPTKKSKSSTSWRNIKQSDSKPLSPQAKKRRWVNSFKLLALSFLVVISLIAIASSFYFLKKNIGGNSLSEYSQFLSHIEIETNGVLREAHIKPLLEVQENSSMMDLDIFAIKDKLESVAQIRSAVVERQFPNTLKVTLDEYQPILKIVAMNKKRKHEGYLLSSEGHIYKGYGYPKETIRNLLYITGVNLRRRGDNSFRSLPHLSAIAKFLEVTRNQAPHLYKQWRFLSLEYFRQGPSSLGAFIKITTKKGIEIVFAPDKFSLQLKRLDAILNYASEQKLATIKSINLSLNNQVAVKIANNPHRTHSFN